MSDRIILHCDCNSFFASVESVLRPELKTVPMAVTGNPENRHGIILAKNELAKRLNVQTAEPIWQAKRKCPELVCVMSHYDKYHEYYERINRIYLDYTDLVEPASIDESFLDVTGTLHLFGKSPKELADSIRQRVESELGITISVGVSFSKIFAKLGSDYKKPNATTVIMREDVPRIAYPLPVGELLFVGRQAAKTLNSCSVYTIGDLAGLKREYLISLLGKQGDMFWKYLHGTDDDTVRSFYDKVPIKSISKGMTFKRDLVGIAEVKCGVNALADAVAGRLRSEHKKCTVIQVSIKDPQFKTIQRQRKLEAPTHLQREIADISMQLITANWNMSKPIRLITIGGAELVSEDEDFSQLSLFGTDNGTHQKLEKLEGAMADIRSKYGKQVIKYANSQNDELGINVSDREER